METFPNDASDARILWQRAQPTAGHGLLCIDLATPTLGRRPACIVMRYNCDNGFWPPWMRNSRAHGYLRPHDFLVSPDAGSIFGPARTGYRAAGSTRGGSFAASHSAGCPKLPRRPPDFSARGFVANVFFEGGVRVS